MIYYKDPKWDCTHIFTMDLLLKAIRDRLSEVEKEIDMEFRGIDEAVSFVIDEILRMQKISGDEYD